MRACIESFLAPATHIRLANLRQRVVAEKRDQVIAEQTVAQLSSPRFENAIPQPCSRVSIERCFAEIWIHPRASSDLDLLVREPQLRISLAREGLRRGPVDAVGPMVASLIPTRWQPAHPAETPLASHHATMPARGRRNGSTSPAHGGRPPGTVAPTSDSSHRQIKHAQPGTHSRRCLGRLPSDPVSSSRPPRPRAALRAVASRRPLTRQPLARILAPAGKDGPEWQTKAVTERVRPAIAADVKAMTAMAADRERGMRSTSPCSGGAASSWSPAARPTTATSAKPSPSGRSAGSPSPPGPRLLLLQDRWLSELQRVAQALAGDRTGAAD